MPHYLEPLFAPRSIAVVGASERAGSLGRAVFENLRAGGYTGILYPVNPKHKQVGGMPCHARLADLPAPPDLAVVVTPAPSVAGVLRDAGAAGIRHAVVLSAGFDENDLAGATLLREAGLHARTHGVRLLGPHCLGLMRPSLGLNATFARGGARPGGLALVSQSGAICAALTDWAWAAGIGFSSVISTGAAVDVDFGEILDYLMFDMQTQSILLYVEGIHDARRFISGLRACARTKPIVVLKAGRHAGAGASGAAPGSPPGTAYGSAPAAARDTTAAALAGGAGDTAHGTSDGADARYVGGLHGGGANAGDTASQPAAAGKHPDPAHHAPARAAALSHTGSLVGDDAVFDAALRRSGVVRAETYAELFAIARLLAAGRLPRGKRLAILSNGGGPGVIAADCAGDKDVTLATLAPATFAALDAALPPHWSHTNPVSILGDATPEHFSAALAPLLADPGVDGVLTLFAPQIVTSAEDAARALLPLASAANKPVLTAWLGEAQVRAGRAIIEAAGMPAFQYPDSGVLAFAALARYAHAQSMLLEVPPPLASAFTPDLASAHKLARDTVAAGRQVLGEAEAKQLLAWFGIPTPRLAIAATLVEAIRLGEEIGFPLALKIVSPDIVHKSDVGGVTLNVRDTASLEREFRNLYARVAKLQPDARLQGVAIQPMIEKRFGRELLVGVARDPVFGQVITFGAGGVAVELLRDHAVGLPPLNCRLADEMIAGTRMAALLGPYRHIPGADREAIIDVLIKVSDMVCALPWLKEMDINPLTVDAHGAMALDARVVIDPARLADDLRYRHMAIHPYPSALVSTETLRDGSTLLLRPIRPEDAAIEREFVEGLSEQSRYMRFFNPLKVLAPRLLARLTQVDYDRELALVATTGSGVEERIVGVVRYSPNADGTSSEFAVTVADDWHGKGLGSLLMRRLIDAARAAGYHRLTGSVLESNNKMHTLMRRLGFASAGHGEDMSIAEYQLDLTDPRPTQKK